MKQTVRPQGGRLGGSYRVGADGTAERVQHTRPAPAPKRPAAAPVPEEPPRKPAKRKDPS